MLPLSMCCSARNKWICQGHHQHNCARCSRSRLPEETLLVRACTFFPGSSHLKFNGILLIVPTWKVQTVSKRFNKIQQVQIEIHKESTDPWWELKSHNLQPAETVSSRRSYMVPQDVRRQPKVRRLALNMPALATFLACCETELTCIGSQANFTSH